MTPREPVTSLRSLWLPIYGPAILYAAAQGAVVPMTPILAARLGATPAQAALAVIAVVSGSVVGAVPGSVITARLGERAVIPLAAAVAASALAVAWAAPTLLVLGLGLLAFGACGAVFQLARQSFLTEAVASHMRARALSTLGGVFRIGMFAGPFLGAAAIQLGGLHTVFPVAIVLALAAGAVSLTLPRTVAVDGEPRGGASAQVRVGDILRTHWRVFLVMGAAVGMLSAVRYSRNVVPPLWADALHLQPQVAALIIGVAGAVDMLVFYPAGRVMDRHGRLAVAVPTLGFMAVGLALVPMTSSWQGLLLASVLVGFGNGIGSGIVMTFGADLSPNVGRPQFLGIFRVLGDLGGLAGPLLVSALTDAQGLRFGIWSVAAVAALGAVAMLGAIPYAYGLRGVSHRARPAPVRDTTPVGEPTPPA